MGATASLTEPTPGRRINPSGGSKGGGNDPPFRKKIAESDPLTISRALVGTNPRPTREGGRKAPFLCGG